MRGSPHLIPVAEAELLIEAGFIGGNPSTILIAHVENLEYEDQWNTVYCIEYIDGEAWLVDQGDDDIKIGTLGHKAWLQ